ncbi:MAG: hypothetical protein IJM25_12400 [Eubacterium sp.]|nr:hypothetical protein [Eubacterium sp.]
MSKSTKNEVKKIWPENCPWPEVVKPGEGEFWEPEDADALPMDDVLEELLEIRDYMDALVEEGRLLEDYTLNPDYEAEEDMDPGEEEDEDDTSFVPEKGIDYWDDGFDIDGWTEDLTMHINLLKLPLPSPVAEIRQIIGYEFINENLLRQAFTRRAFALEYGIGDCEKLEFLGDSVLNQVVTQEVIRQLTDVDVTRTEEPFYSRHGEGELSRIREHFTCGEYLSDRARKLGLDQYILYGTGEHPSDSAAEDMMEALIGAVVIDSDWDWKTLEEVIDRLLCIQLMHPDRILKTTYYELMNAWHQKHFGQMPEYEVDRHVSVNQRRTDYDYHCSLRFQAPENDTGVWIMQRVEADAETRSGARELAARLAYAFLVDHGLWIRLSDAGIEPRLEDAINQLQELYQKKYIDQPVYEFEEFGQDEWSCTCICGGVDGLGRAGGKTKAKKKAAFMTLVRLMKSAGICRDEWEREMWRMFSEE